jgi:hypothetical protein
MGSDGMCPCTPSPTDTMPLLCGARRWPCGCCVRPPPRRAPQVVVAYAQAALAADVYQQVAAALTGESTLRGAFLLDPGAQAVGTPTGGRLTLVQASTLLPGEVLLRREDGQPLALAVATRDAEHSLTVAPMAEAARQALAGEAVSVLPARM